MMVQGPWSLGWLTFGLIGFKRVIPSALAHDIHGGLQMPTGTAGYA